MDDAFYWTTVDKFVFKVKRDLSYTEKDVWAAREGDFVRLGVTDFFQRLGGDIVYIELPKVGKEIKKLDEIVRIETIKAVLSAHSPLDGTVVEVNETLLDRPEVINEDPFGRGWLTLLSPHDPDDFDQLLTAEQYFELMRSKIDDELMKRRLIR